MVTFTDKDKEIVASAERRVQNKANLLGKDGYVVSEPYGRNLHLPFSRIMQNSPDATFIDAYGLAVPQYDDADVNEGSVGTRYELVRLHPYLPSGINGPESVQTFLTIQGTPASHSIDDINDARLNPLLAPEYTPGKATAAEASVLQRGFEIALFPARSSGGTGTPLVADTTNGPISPTADPGAGLPVELESGAGEKGFWTVDYDAGVVRFSRPPLNGANGVMNPNNVFGDINGNEVDQSDGYGAVTMFATYYIYSGSYGVPDNLSFVTVGDGYQSFGIFTGNDKNTIQSAVNSLAGSGNGGTVFVKEGDYNFAGGAVEVPANVHVQGLGTATRIDKGAGTDAFQLYNSSSKLSDLRIVANTDDQDELRLGFGPFGNFADAVYSSNSSLGITMVAAGTSRDDILVTFSAETDGEGGGWSLQSGTTNPINRLKFWPTAGSGGTPLFMSLGDVGEIKLTGDGYNYTSLVTGVGAVDKHSADWDGSTFVMVGEGDEYLTSADGYSWSAMASNTDYIGTGVNIYDIKYAAGIGKWVMVGDNGTIATSTAPTVSTSVWATRKRGTSNSYIRVKYDGADTVIAVTAEGDLAISVDGDMETWNFGSFGTGVSDLEYANGRWYVSLSGGPTTLYSFDGFSWAVAPLTGNGGAVGPIVYNDDNDYWYFFENGGFGDNETAKIYPVFTESACVRIGSDGSAVSGVTVDGVKIEATPAAKGIVLRGPSTAAVSDVNITNNHIISASVNDDAGAAIVIESDGVTQTFSDISIYGNKTATHLGLQMKDAVYPTNLVVSENRFSANSGVSVIVNTGGGDSNSIFVDNLISNSVAVLNYNAFQFANNMVSGVGAFKTVDSKVSENKIASGVTFIKPGNNAPVENIMFNDNVVDGYNMITDATVNVTFANNKMPSGIDDGSEALDAYGGHRYLDITGNTLGGQNVLTKLHFSRVDDNTLGNLRIVSRDRIGTRLELLYGSSISNNLLVPDIGRKGSTARAEIEVLNLRGSTSAYVMVDSVIDGNKGFDTFEGVAKDTAIRFTYETVFGSNGPIAITSSITNNFVGELTIAGNHTSNAISNLTISENHVGGNITIENLNSQTMSNCAIQGNHASNLSIGAGTVPAVSWGGNVLISGNKLNSMTAGSTALTAVQTGGSGMIIVSNFLGSATLRGKLMTTQLASNYIGSLTLGSIEETFITDNTFFSSVTINESTATSYSMNRSGFVGNSFSSTSDNLTITGPLESSTISNNISAEGGGGILGIGSTVSSLRAINNCHIDNNTFSSITIDYTGTPQTFTTASFSTIDSNKCGTMSIYASFDDTVDEYALEGVAITGNTITSTFRLGSDTRATDVNTYFETVVSNNVIGNTSDWKGKFLNCIISGNQCASVDFDASFEDTLIKGNNFANVNMICDGPLFDKSIFEGNTIQADGYFASRDDHILYFSVFANNLFADDSGTFNESDCTMISGSTSTSAGDGHVFSSIISNNFTDGFWNISNNNPGSEALVFEKSMFSGNIIRDGQLIGETSRPLTSITMDNSLFTGNRYDGDITIHGTVDRSMISNNYGNDTGAQIDLIIRRLKGASVLGNTFGRIDLDTGGGQHVNSSISNNVCITSTDVNPGEMEVGHDALECSFLNNHASIRIHGDLTECAFVGNHSVLTDGVTGTGVDVFTNVMISGCSHGISLTNRQMVDCAIVGNMSVSGGRLTLTRNTDASGSDAFMMEGVLIASNAFESIDIDWQVDRDNATVLRRCAIVSNMCFGNNITSDGINIDAETAASDNQTLVFKTLIANNQISNLDINSIAVGGSSITLKDSVIANNVGGDDTTSQFLSIFIGSDGSETAAEDVLITGNKGSLSITDDSNKLAIVGNYFASCGFTGATIDDSVISGNMIEGTLRLYKSAGTIATALRHSVVSANWIGIIDADCNLNDTGIMIDNCVFTGNYVEGETRFTVDNQLSTGLLGCVFTGNLFDGTVTLENIRSSFTGSTIYTVLGCTFTGNVFGNFTISAAGPDGVVVSDTTITGNYGLALRLEHTNGTDTPQSVIDDTVISSNRWTNITLTAAYIGSIFIDVGIIGNYVDGDILITNTSTDTDNESSTLHDSVIANNTSDLFGDLFIYSTGINKGCATGVIINGNDLRDLTIAQLATASTSNGAQVLSGCNITSNQFFSVLFQGAGISRVLDSVVFSNNSVSDCTFDYKSGAQGVNPLMEHTLISTNHFGNDLIMGVNAAGNTRAFRTSSMVGNIFHSGADFIIRSPVNTTIFDDFLVLGNISAAAINWDDMLTTPVIPTNSNSSEYIIAFNRFATWTGFTADVSNALAWSQSATGGGAIATNVTITTTEGRTINWT